MTPGLLIAAPASGSGKTVLTLGLLRHYRDAGRAVASVKVGPDYIDPAFHTAASGRACLNLDGWAMRPGLLTALAAEAGAGAELVLGEGVMGLFDGALGGPDDASRTVAPGSTAEVALLTGWPLVLVVDAKGLGASATALLRGFTGHCPGLAFAGVVFNRVGSARHAALLRAACAPLGLPVLGALPRDPALALPERHLGLVQAGEHAALDDFLTRAAAIVSAQVDVAALVASAAAAPRGAANPPAPPLPPLGQRIAVAADVAFAFAYPFVLAAWRAAGAEVSTFSPLADEAPDAAADAVYLPGGYPELHAGRLAGNRRFLDGLRAAAARGATVYGECGGYMVLGRGLRGGDGIDHAMAGLLPLETSFAEPRRHLGYRAAALLGDGPLGAKGARFRGHEFHFAREEPNDDAEALFACHDAAGIVRGRVGRRRGRVMGSFLHLIDREP